MALTEILLGQHIVFQYYVTDCFLKNLNSFVTFFLLLLLFFTVQFLAPWAVFQIPHTLGRLYKGRIEFVFHYDKHIVCRGLLYTNALSKLKFLFFNNDIVYTHKGSHWTFRCFRTRNFVKCWLIYIYFFFFKLSNSNIILQKFQ